MKDQTENKKRAPAITEQQLFECCDEYFKQHKKEPSQKIIRDLIGGSPSTIGPLLRKWKEKRANEAQAILLMPDHIRDSGLTLIATWWHSIQPTIKDMVDTVQELANKKISTAEQVSKDAVAAQTWLEEENDRIEELAMNVRIDHQQQLEDLQAQLTQSQLEIKQAYECAGTEKEKLATMTGECEALKEQIVQHDTEMKTVRKICKEQIEQGNTEQERLFTQLNDLKETNSECEKEKKVIANELVGLTSAKAKIEGKLTSTQQQLIDLKDEVKNERITHKKELALAQKDKATAEGKLEAQIEFRQTAVNSKLAEEKSEKA